MTDPSANGKDQAVGLQPKAGNDRRPARKKAHLAGRASQVLALSAAFICGQLPSINPKAKTGSMIVTLGVTRASCP